MIVYIKSKFYYFFFITVNSNELQLLKEKINNNQYIEGIY